jgi:hypothetical protein
MKHAANSWLTFHGSFGIIYQKKECGIIYQKEECSKQLDDFPWIIRHYIPEESMQQTAG